MKQEAENAITYNKNYPYGISEYEKELEEEFSKVLKKKDLEDLDRQTEKFYAFRKEPIIRKATKEELERANKLNNKKEVLV